MVEASLSAPRVVNTTQSGDFPVGLTFFPVYFLEKTRYSRTIVTVGSPASGRRGASARRRGRHALQYLLVVVGCIFLVDALVGEKGLLEMIKKRQEYRALEQSLERARQENARLREEARRLREDPAAIEDVARRELGLIKPGERLFIVKDVPAPTARP
jgi:cell division protein FtsB